MKAISILQPWASLIAIGVKHIETRTWKTDYRGALAIHASKGFRDEARSLCFDPTFARYIRFPLPLGCIIAICRLGEVYPISASDWIPSKERPFGDYTPGRYGWMLEDIHALAEPIPIKGRLRLWDWDEGGYNEYLR